jgi:hypothetical protein
MAAVRVAAAREAVVRAVAVMVEVRVEVMEC